MRSSTSSGIGVERAGATTTSSAKAPTKHEPKTRSPTPTPVDALADLGDHAGELAARDEGQWRGHLVRVGDHQQVGEVDGPDVDADP